MTRIALEDLAAEIASIEGDRVTLDKVRDVLRAAGIQEHWVFRAVIGDVQASYCEPDDGTTVWRITKTPITDLPNAPAEPTADRAA